MEDRLTVRGVSRFRARRFVLFGWIASVLACGIVRGADAQTLPSEIASQHFVVTVNGRAVPVAHAAANYYFANFDLKKGAKITVTAESDDYWQRGVEVQPWRLGIRPEVKGRTIRVSLDGPQKISITRPGDFLAGAEMLFLFANTPEKDAPHAGAPKLRYFGTGVYRENISPASGDTIYLAPGAVVLGSLNLWGVENVRVFGRGIIVYDGPQNPKDDEGWIHRPNWHAIVMDNARHISIEGITCVVRSRTWMIQMKDSRDVRFDNVKVIGGGDANANQDGMDWLGGGDTRVSDSFFRTADDIFALQGNWDGYAAEKMAIPGHEVSNIVVEKSVLSTSISNVVRVGWPHKSFDSHNFTMRDTDVLHAGLGACVVPFALLEIWADPDGRGQHSQYLFDDVRLEDWYSLVQLRQENPAISDIMLRDVTALESPSLVPSVLSGDVSRVRFNNVSIVNQPVEKDEDLPLERMTGAKDASYNDGPRAPRASFRYSSGLITPHRSVMFDASATSAGDAKIVSYRWTFGDGTSGTGRSVRHSFADDEGTLRDHSGRFRVLLEVTDTNGRRSWAYEPVVVARSAQEPVAQRADESGVAAEDFLDVPADGGYTFTLLSSDGAGIEIDSKVVAASPPAWRQVCGSPGNAVQRAMGSIAMRAGRHVVRIQHDAGEDGLRVMWQGPGIELTDVPATALSRGEAKPSTAPGR